MKEKDLDRVIDDMITEGLIKEGEQDNADFEAAVRNMSEEDFLAMIYEAKGRQRKPWRIWLAAAVSAAAVIAIVLIPAYRSMNASVCGSALVACEAYMSPARGGLDISKADIDEIRRALTALEAEYEDAFSGKSPSDPYASNPAEAGWDLAMAYLRLEERSKAKDVLSVLADRYRDDEFGSQCRKIAEIL